MVEYTIALSSDGLCLIQKVKGEINRQGAVKMNVEAHAEGKRLHINKYLVDVTEAINTETTTGNYQFAYSDMKESEVIDKTARIATLVKFGDHSHDFVETVARNAGFNIRIFSDKDQAYQFLLAK